MYSLTPLRPSVNRPSVKKLILLSKAFVPQPWQQQHASYLPITTTSLLRILDRRTRLPDPFAAFLDYVYHREGLSDAMFAWPRFCAL